MASSEKKKKKRGEKLRIAKRRPALGPHNLRFQATFLASLFAVPLFYSQSSLVDSLLHQHATELI